MALRMRDVELSKVTVDPAMAVATALPILIRERVSVAGVVAQNRFLGIVELYDLLAADETATVASLTKIVPTCKAGTESLHRVVREITRSGLSVAAVEEDGKFIGIALSDTLVHALCSSWDPLTDLPWGDEARRWGQTKLASGNEIAVIFVDIDDFGRYNKLYGHQIGDHVLKSTAEILVQTIDPDVDVLARFGGDEFIVTSIRPRHELEALAEVITQQLHDKCSSVAPVPVTFSVGVAGGQRSNSRPGIHASANTDDLIGIASKACMAQKGYQDRWLGKSGMSIEQIAQREKLRSRPL